MLYYYNTTIGFNWFANSRSKCFNDEKGTRGCNAIDVRGKCQSEGGPNWLVKEAAIFTCTTQGSLLLIKIIYTNLNHLKIFSVVDVIILNYT